MADSSNLRLRRHRAHMKGDHTLCRPERCPLAGQREPAGENGLIQATLAEFGPDDHFSRELAVQLATIGTGRNTAAVAALRGLAEFAAHQRRTVGAR